MTLAERAGLHLSDGGAAARMAAARDAGATAETSVEQRTVYVGDLGPFMYKDDEFFTSCTTGVSNEGTIWGLISCLLTNGRRS